MKTLLVWTGADDGPLCAALARIPDLRIVQAASAAEAAATMPEADGMVTSVVPWDAVLMAALRSAPRLKWLQVLNAGYDNLEALGLPARIDLSTTGSLGSELVAEHALALLLALFRELPRSFAATPPSPSHTAQLRAGIRTLRFQTIVIVGFGPIGRCLARLLLAAGARPIALARRPRTEAGIEVRALASLLATLADAAGVAICAPLNASTRRLIDRRAFAALRPGAVLVNVSRGAVIDTQALCEALDSGHLAGAGLDVTDPEPLPAGHPLWGRPNVIVTPHVAFAGGGAREQQQRIEFVLDNAARFASGTPQPHAHR
ncbi:MAG TPA: NAD(P)-dependent oxidoreductase [Steroidobacteraceae bacterium]|nr:NAD(P)-dependent oxidoreductase [Steroidobacteraceae bacterium]